MKHYFCLLVQWQNSYFRSCSEYARQVFPCQPQTSTVLGYKASWFGTRCHKPCLTPGFPVQFPSCWQPKRCHAKGTNWCMIWAVVGLRVWWVCLLLSLLHHHAKCLAAVAAIILRGPSSICFCTVQEAVQCVWCRKQRSFQLLGKGDPTVPGALLAHATASGAVGAAITATAIALLARAFSITCWGTLF